MSSFFELKSYLNHSFRARGRGGHGVHSPLIYELVTQVLGKKNYHLDYFNRIEKERKAFLCDNTILEVEDFGAGSRVSNTAKRKVSEIAKSALQPARSAQSLAKTIHHYRPENILELGTSLGITTAYLASANPLSRVVSIEGSANIAARAAELWKRLDLDNISPLIGNIDHQLAPALEQLSKIDFALIDGNHRHEPTLRYFEQIRNYCHSDSIVVLDDIHWSAEMNSAWEEIIELPQVTASVDFFHFGMLYFKEGRAKEHFRMYLP